MILHRCNVNGIVIRDNAVDKKIVLDINLVSQSYSAESIKAVLATGIRNSMNITLNNSPLPKKSLNTGYNNIGIINCFNIVKT